MVHILIGAAAATGFFVLWILSAKKAWKVRWWQWALTLIAIAYAVFVLEIIVSFLDEGMSRGALVMGLVLGFVALIWGVLPPFITAISNSFFIPGSPPVTVHGIVLPVISEGAVEMAVTAADEIPVPRYLIPIGEIGKGESFRHQFLILFLNSLSR